jgi:hypothetical protein
MTKGKLYEICVVRNGRATQVAVQHSAVKPTKRDPNNPVTAAAQKAAYLQNANVEVWDGANLLFTIKKSEL